VTFAPGLPPRSPVSSVVRIVLFWVLMILLATVFWYVKDERSSQTVQVISYSDFMQQVDLKHVSSAKFYTSESTADVQGLFRQPPQAYKVTIPKEVISPLIERLRNQGVPIEVGTEANVSWPRFIVNISPFLLLLGVWILMLRRKRNKPASSAPSELSNRPLG
jgi:ATP-dependent Zn protease